MHTTDLLRRMLALMAFALSLTPSAKAQNATTAQAPLVLHVAGLTSSKRDLIKLELDAQGDHRLSYACVPAGILILVPMSGRSVVELRGQIDSIIQRHVPQGRWTELTMTQQQAEDRCAQVR